MMFLRLIKWCLIAGVVFCFQAARGMLQTQGAEMLPAWISNLNSDTNHYYALGISDPGLSKHMAYKQAKIRAAAILQMRSGFGFAKVTESFGQDYSNHPNRSKLTSLLEIVVPFDTVNMEVENCHYSEFKECFLLVKEKIGEKQKPGSMSLRATMYYSGNSTDELKTFGKFELEVLNDADEIVQSYKKYFLSGRIELEAVLQDSINVSLNDHYVYRYAADVNTAKIKDDFLKVSLNKSFWHGYISVIFESLRCYFHSNATFSSFNEKNNSRYQSLKRSVSFCDYQMKIYNVNIFDNYIQMDSVVLKTRH